MGENNKEYLEMTDRKRICAGIVTYYPDIEKLRENLDHIVRQVNKVYVIDNGSRIVDEIGCLLREYGAVCSLLTNTENMGIAAALNQLCHKAKKDGYEWILMLDQDSVCPDNLIDELTGHMDEECAVVAPKIVYRGNEQYSVNGQNDCEEVPWVITSASLTNVQAWETIGGFDEYLFIDKVDYDFCIRLNRAGYKVYRVNTVSLLHELGNLKCRKIAGRTIYVTNHSAFRRYYMVRNSIYLSDKLKEKGARIYILKNIVKVVCFEDGKMSKLRAIQKGIFDGIEKIRGGY